MSTKPFSVFVVRPYHPKIRKLVLQLLEGVNGLIPEGWMSSERATDKEVILNLSHIRPDMLLIPFHAHRDAKGYAVNGISTLITLQNAYSWCHAIPVVMPVSKYAGQGYQLTLNELNNGTPMANVFTIHEDDLSSATLPGQLRSFLHGYL